MAALNRSSSISTRAATHDDVPLLSALEAACEPPSRRLGATVLNHSRQHHFIATEAGPSHLPVGALLTLRFEHLHELIGTDATRVHSLHRDGGGLLLMRCMWLAPTAQARHDEIEAELLRCAMLSALKTGGVRHALLPVRCRAEIAALDEGANYMALRYEPHVSRQMERGAKLLQQLLPAWWPADGDAPAGARARLSFSFPFAL